MKMKRVKQIIHSVLLWKWLPLLCWAILILPSCIFLIRYWNEPTKTVGDSFLIQAFAIILAAFITWLIWERSRTNHGREEDLAASKGRDFLFRQANGLMHDVWKQICEKLVGDYPVAAQMIEHIEKGKWPSLLERLRSYSPNEIFQRGKQLLNESTHFVESADRLRWLAYTQAVQLHLTQFIVDFEEFNFIWNSFRNELENPVSDPEQAILRIDLFAQNLLDNIKTLSKKMKSKKYS